MAIYDVILNNQPIDFNPQNVVAEILQNVRTILTTTLKSVPYDRKLGIDPQYLDDPMELSKIRLQADIVRAVHEGEPRCRVESISYEDDKIEGLTMPTVRIFINE